VWDLLTILLLLLPVDVVPRWFRAPPEMHDALKRVAKAADLVGEVERWTDSYLSELSWCRRTLVHLADAPPSSDANRFPDSTLARDCCRANATYQRFLEARQAFDLRRHEEWGEVLAEARQLAAVWEAVAATTDPAEWTPGRRRALRRLRTLLGPDAYAAGLLPPCVPLWRFERID